MTDSKPTLQSVADKAIKHQLLNIDPADEVARMRVIKQVHKVAPCLLAMRNFVDSKKGGNHE
jgi:hypothetical protein